jgi:hypothetical protein
VALTLPEDAIERLHRINPDLAWAVVTLLNQPMETAAGADTPPDVELVAVAGRGSLIVVNHEVIRTLPGVNIIPLDTTRAFLALDAGRGMSDLELCVGDRLLEPDVDRRERRALIALHAHLRTWRKDETLRFETRSIIVAERVRAPRTEGRGSPTTRTTSRSRAARQARGRLVTDSPGERLTAVH